MGNYKSQITFPMRKRYSLAIHIPFDNRDWHCNTNPLNYLRLFLVSFFDTKNPFEKFNNGFTNIDEDIK